MLIRIMIFTSLTGNKTGPTNIWSKEYTPSGPTSNYLDRSKVQWSKWIGPRNTLTPQYLSSAQDRPWTKIKGSEYPGVIGLVLKQSMYYYFFKFSNKIYPYSGARKIYLG